MNLLELKNFVVGKFYIGEMINSIHHGTGYTFAGIGKYNGKYKHQVGKRVFLLDVKKTSANCANLFFELLLPLVNAYFRGEELTAKSYHTFVNEAGEADMKQQYPDVDLHKYYYLAAAVAIGQESIQLQGVATGSEG